MTSTLPQTTKIQIRAGLSGYVAELSGAFLCAELGIVPTVRHSDYIGAWLALMRADNRAVLRAASAASRAADHILAYGPATRTQGQRRGAASRFSRIDGAAP